MSSFDLIWRLIVLLLLSNSNDDDQSTNYYDGELGDENTDQTIYREIPRNGKFQITNDHLEQLINEAGYVDERDFRSSINMLHPWESGYIPGTVRNQDIPNMEEEQI